MVGPQKSKEPKSKNQLQALDEVNAGWGPLDAMLLQHFTMGLTQVPVPRNQMGFDRGHSSVTY